MLGGDPSFQAAVEKERFKISSQERFLKEGGC